MFKTVRSRAVVSWFGVSALVWVWSAQMVCAAAPPDPAQTVAPAVATAPTPPISAPSPAPQSVRIPEGTEVHVHLDESLSSATATEGDTFTVVSDEDVALPGGTTLPAGYVGRGEVSHVEKTGMLGKAGQLGIRLEYLKIGDTRLHLRATKSSEGKDNVTTMVVTAVLLTPLFLFIHGHSMIFPKGQPIVAYVDNDTTISLPLPLPPLPD